MKSRRLFLASGLAMVSAILWTLGGCSTGSTDAVPTGDRGVTGSADAGGGLRISGPFTHENLSVFLVHSDKRDERDFITLDEGLKSKLVTVSEKKSAQVSELIINNKSGKPLFLQEGDRITGGKQDRTIYTSLVVKANSGPMPIPSFCVEASRWQAGANGRAFQYGGNKALANVEIRRAAKVGKSQGQVWQQVAQKKAQYHASLNISSKTSSLNEALDSKEVAAAAGKYEAHLGKVANDKSDVVGVAVVINGQIEEISIYPGHKLWAKIYPRLLQSYASDAAATVPKKGKVKSLVPADVVAFMRGEGDQKQKKVRIEKVNGGNGLQIDGDLLRYKCDSKWEDLLIHRQWLRRDVKAEAGQRQQIRQYRQNNIQVQPVPNGSNSSIPEQQKN
jgi:hypothetical protein